MLSSSDFAANLLGWKLNEELSEWMKVSLSLDIAVPERDRANEEGFLTDGRELWSGLREQAHGGRRQERRDRKTTERWLKFSAKARRKVGRVGAGLGLPDPASFPDSKPAEIAAFLEHRTAPAWATEIADSVRGLQSEDAPDGHAAALVERATAMLEGDWMFSNRAGEAAWGFAGDLAADRTEHNLALDALALGYFLRAAESELSDDLNTYDDAYAAKLRTTAEDDPVMALAIGALSTAEALPEPFAFAESTWETVVDLALEVLRAREAAVLASDYEFDNSASLSDEARTRALGYGYGLCIAADALSIRGIVER